MFYALLSNFRCIIVVGNAEQLAMTFGRRYPRNLLIHTEVFYVNVDHKHVFS